ncbi:MAG: hypothetical protein KF795_22795 [Labilithrix sp.]|nr:hypothetical protein [Labilithrix sp.]
MNITATQLNSIAKDSDRYGYNRLLLEDFVAEGEGWSLHPALIHEHIAGEPAAPHMRCFLKKDDEVFAILDVSFPMLDRTRRECVKLGLARAADVGLGPREVATVTSRAKRTKAARGKPVKATQRLIMGAQPTTRSAGPRGRARARRAPEFARELKSFALAAPRDRRRADRAVVRVLGVERKTNGSDARSACAAVGDCAAWGSRVRSGGCPSIRLERCSPAQCT